MQSRSIKFIIALSSAAAFMPRVAMAVDLPSLNTVETEVGVRHIIQGAQLGNYVRGFGATIEDGQIRLRGWVPDACKDFITVTLGAPGTENIYDAEAHAYPLYIEGHSVTQADGTVMTPEQCFEAHPATACNLSINASERNCSPLAEVAPQIASYALGESGDVVLRIASTQLDPNGTGEPLPPTTFGAPLAHYTSAAEIAAAAAAQAAANAEREAAATRAEEQAMMEGICARAAEGDMDAIGELRDFASMVDVANRLEARALETEFDRIAGLVPNTLSEARDKAEELWAFAQAHNDFRQRVGEALMDLSDDISEHIEAGENDDDVRFDRRRLDLRERLIADARRLGARNTTLALDRIAFAQLELEARHPSRDGSRYNAARRRVERMLSRTGHLARLANREARTGAEERPYTRLYLDGNRLLGPETGRRGERRAGGLADELARSSWRESASRGDFNSRSEGSGAFGDVLGGAATGYGATYNYSASPNQMFYSPYAMPMPYAVW
jgi:hypothetical protein